MFAVVLCVGCFNLVVVCWLSVVLCCESVVVLLFVFLVPCLFGSRLLFVVRCVLCDVWWLVCPGCFVSSVARCVLFVGSLFSGCCVLCILLVGCCVGCFVSVVARGTL